jgi:16S rRNA (adenine1518-N6/adenine1519-N6)-dimethyltransferase
MGVLTKYLLDKPINTYVIEIDTESVDYLDTNYPKLKDKIISKIFCGMISMRFFRKTVYNGNFHTIYQLRFLNLKLKHQIPEFAGMFQKKSGETYCEKRKGLRNFGANLYDVEYLFTVDEMFYSATKSKIRCNENAQKTDYSLPCGDCSLKQLFNSEEKTV